MAQSVIKRTVPTVEATPDYSAGDTMGGIQNLSDVVAALGDGGVIEAVSMHAAVDLSSLSVSILFFDGSPTASTTTENATFVLHADDKAKLIGATELALVSDLGTPVVRASTPRLPFVCNNSKNLYAVAIAGGTINLGAATDLSFVYALRRDRDQ